MTLKDWKKVSDTKFINKKRAGTLYIGKSLFTNKPDVSIQIDKVKIGRIKFPKTAIYEEFKSKSSALRFAKNYMKTGDIPKGFYARRH